MDLWLVRHGEAVSANQDPARPLSSDGIRAISAVASIIADQVGRLDLVASSGKRRARQTAEIVAAAAGYPVDRIRETGTLSPDAPAEAFLAFLDESRHSERVLCVGHLPSIARIASLLLSSEDPVHLVFDTGSVCRIHLSPLLPGAGELLFFR